MKLIFHKLLIKKIKMNTLNIFISSVLITLATIFFTPVKNVPDFKNYYHHINIAEYYVIQNKLDSALIQYNIAFNFVNKSNAIDIYNAGKCALLLENKKTFDYFLLLADKGVKIENLPISSLEKLNNKKYKRFSKEYLKKRENALVLKDSILRNIISKMHEEDQKAAVAKNEDMNKRDEFYLCVYENMLKLMKISKEKEFPNENLIGIDDVKRYNASWILIDHYIQRIEVENLFQDTDTIYTVNHRKLTLKQILGDDSFQFNSIDVFNFLSEEVKKGNIYPRTCKSFYSDTDLARYGDYLYVIINDRIWEIIYNETQQSRIDSLRNALLIEPFDCYKKKIQFLENKFSNDKYIYVLNGKEFDFEKEFKDIFDFYQYEIEYTELDSLQAVEKLKIFQKRFPNMKEITNEQ